MKIGILTYHRSNNYGALLQAVALRHILSQMGHIVYYVDYWPEYHRRMYTTFSFHRFFHSKGCIDSARYLFNALRFYTLRKKRICNIRVFIHEQIEPHCKSYDSTLNYDVIIYGSDQIWRKQPTQPRKFNSVYFGDNIIKTTSHISYAASMGQETLDEVDKGFITRKLSRFKSLSVREDDLKDFLSGLGLKARTDLDPTMLLDKMQWEALLNIPTQNRAKYVLYYRLIWNSFDEGEITRIAKRMGCELIVLDGMPRTKRKGFLSTCNPQEFISLIKYAEVIFTSSFHGLAFSILYNKTFYASFENNGGRAKSLLDKLGLQDRLLPPNSSISEVTRIDYTYANSRLELLMKESLDFLHNL